MEESLGTSDPVLVWQNRRLSLLRPDRVHFLRIFWTELSIYQTKVPCPFALLAISTFIPRFSSGFTHIPSFNSLSNQIGANSHFPWGRRSIYQKQCYRLLDEPRDFLICLWFAFKLQMSLWNQDRENSRQTFTVVWSFQILVFFFEESYLSCIVVHSLGNGCLQTCLVGSPSLVRTLLNEGQDIIWVAIIVLHSHFYLETIWFATKVENRC